MLTPKEYIDAAEQARGRKLTKAEQRKLARQYVAAEQAQAVTDYLASGARKIAQYLDAMPTVTSTTPCIIVIKGSYYAACLYKQRLTNTLGTRAHPERREYDREMVYVVGLLPAVVRNGNAAFAMPNSINEWYVAGYFPAYQKRRQRQGAVAAGEHHPFGANFLLSPWDASDGIKIDHHARTPYKRVPITLTPVSD